MLGERRNAIIRSMKLWGIFENRNRSSIAVSILIVLALLVYLIVTAPEEFIFEEHLQETAVTVTDNATGESEEVLLQELSYYIMLSEANVEALAEVYNSENTNQFWNIFTNHTFIKDKAKSLAYDSCVRDVIYTMEAAKAGITLDAEEIEEVKARAQSVCDGLSYKQTQVTQLTPEVMVRVLTRVHTASKYANWLLENHDFSASEHMPEVEVEVGGDYYESIKANYTLEDADFWEEINLGDITIEPVENT